MNRYYTNLLCSFIRESYPETDFKNKTSCEIIQYGKKNKLKKMYHFKKTDLVILPRVKKILGIIKSLHVESIIDFGSQI
mgnify:FL=1|jgi:hypothetical protein